MSRDTGRRSVYLAEDAAFEGTPLVEAPGTETLATALASLFDSSWWRAHGIPVPAVKFRAGRNDGFVRPGRPVDRDPSGRRPTLLSLGSEAPWHVASHEIAHLTTGSDDQIHGAAFRAGHVAVAGATLGTDCADALHRSYQQFGFSIAPIASIARPTDRPIWESLIGWNPSVVGWRPERRTAHGSDSSAG